jgi:hypothetical protein
VVLPREQAVMTSWNAAARKGKENFKHYADWMFDPLFMQCVMMVVQHARIPCILASIRSLKSLLHTLNPDIAITVVAMSNLPNVIVH